MGLAAGLLLMVACFALTIGPFVFLQVRDDRARRARQLDAWTNLRNDPDVQAVYAEGDGCIFETVHGNGRVTFNMDSWLIEADWRPDTLPISMVRKKRSLMRRSFQTTGPNRWLDFLVGDDLHDLLDTRHPLSVELGPRVSMRVEVLERYDALLLLRIARHQRVLWADAQQALRLRLVGSPLNQSGQVAGGPLDVLVRKSGLRITLRRRLGGSFRIEHVDHADPEGRIDLGDPVLGMTLAAFGDDLRVRQVLQHHEAVLHWVHGHPGSVLSEGGLELHLVEMPSDQELIALVEGADAFLSVLT